MTLPISTIARFPATALAIALPLLFSSCRRDPPVVDSPGPPVLIAPELGTNNLGQLPGAISRYMADSPIRWQPWTTETLEHAKAANRMIFAIIAMPQQPGFAWVMEALEGDRMILDTLNQFYVPVMIDGDAVREIGLLTADLCAEINRPLSLPLFLWMSPEANPVAWIPAPASDPERISELFFQSHSMVSRIWVEDYEYVLNNSRLDNENRSERIMTRRNRDIASESPAEDAVRAIRQLTSLYDPLSRNFDEVGGLFPAGAVELLAAAAMQPELPPDIRQRALDTTRELMKDVLGSAMFDPLDGGLFAARRGVSWSLPVFHRDCLNQARAAFALIRAHLATGDALALERALGVIAFSEGSYQTSDGLFSIGFSAHGDPQAWLWSIEEIERVLDEADAAWWIALTGMRGLGNIPYEADPQREFFRGNSIALPAGMADLAAAEGSDPADFQRRLDRVRKLLAAHRDEKSGRQSRDETAHAGASFRMVSAYAAAFTATKDPVWRDKASTLLAKSREAFSDGPRLRTFASDGPPSLVDARAFIYTLAIQAIIDVVDISGDESWLDWADDLATVMTEQFSSDGFLSEVSKNATIIDLPITDIIMLFDESSVGLLSFSECRLAARNRPLARELRGMAAPLPVSAVDRPILHTDLIQAFVSRLFPVTVVFDDRTAADLRQRIDSLPLRMIHRRPAVADDALAEGSAHVIIGDQPPLVVRNPDELINALLPASAQP